MYDCIIIAIDTNEGYQALHEYVQDGWTPIYHWQDKFGTHMIIRRERP